MTKQTTTGKAFEYATIKILYEYLSTVHSIRIIENSSYNLAKNSYDLIQRSLQEDMDKAAKAAVKMLLNMEPNLSIIDDADSLYLSIQGDKEGQKGDVRDIIAIKSQGAWEIGISCKHNHSAVKHSRLSVDIDFGAKWLNLPSSQTYFNEIKPIFNELKVLKQEGFKWAQVDNKDDRFYVPILNAFMTELKSLDSSNPSCVPQKLLSYLLGNKDFYKIIANKIECSTKIQGFNITGTLNQKAGKIKPQIKVPCVTMPTKILDISFKPNSKNTIIVVCNEGWSISMRIHNASSKVEPSLKFDVKLQGVPDKLYSHDEHWQ